MRIRFGWNVLAVVCCLLAPLVAGAQTGVPALVLQEAHHQFGVVFDGETVKHDFILYNKGGADLSIEKVKSG
jgi:hypothetical protein